MSDKSIQHGIKSGGVYVNPDTNTGDSEDTNNANISGIFSIVGDIFNKIKTLASDITSPITGALSGLKNIVTNISSAVSSLCSNIIDGIKNFFEDTVNNIKNLADFVGNFWTKFLDFFIHIFVPTDEQWKELSNNQSNMGNSLKSHLPFISLFNSEYKKAQETVAQSDFLIITIPEFSFEGGGIIAKSDSQKVINVRDKYEPYRPYIRNLLFFIVIACAFVLIIKHVLNYQGVFNDSSSKGGYNK